MARLVVGSVFTLLTPLLPLLLLLLPFDCLFTVAFPAVVAVVVTPVEAFGWLLLPDPGMHTQIHM